MKIQLNDHNKKFKKDHEDAGIKYGIFAYYPEFEDMVPGYYATMKEKEYIPEIWIGHYERATIPDLKEGFKDRRKAKRALNRYRKYRAKVLLALGIYLPFNYI